MTYLAGAMMITVLSCSAAYAKAIKWDDDQFLEPVEISLCKKAIKDGHFLAESAGRYWFSLYYLHDQFLYKQRFHWNHELECKRWSPVD